MNHRLGTVIAALVITAFAAGCSTPSTQDPGSSSTSQTPSVAAVPVMIPPDSTSSAPSIRSGPAIDVTGAEAVMKRGLEAMFTWYPATDQSSVDAIKRAAPWLTVRMARATASTRPTLQWSEWKTARATVIASARVQSDEPDIADSSTVIRRVVSITQRVDTGTGAPEAQPPMTAWVTALMTRAGWRISELRF